MDDSNTIGGTTNVETNNPPMADIDISTNPDGDLKPTVINNTIIKKVDLTETMYQQILSRMKLDLNINNTIEKRLKKLTTNNFVTIDNTHNSGVTEDIFYINTYNIININKYKDIDGVYKMDITFVGDVTLQLEYFDVDEMNSDYSKIYEQQLNKFSTSISSDTQSTEFDEDSDSDSD